MKANYLKTVHMVEKLHRQFLELLKAELDRLGIEDINNIQSLILFSIGPDDITIGELTYRGYYLGSNVSYNVKNMVESGYLEQNRSAHDKRSVRVRLTEKGKDLQKTLQQIFDRHIEALQINDIALQDLKNFIEFGDRLEKFWLYVLNNTWKPVV